MWWGWVDGGWWSAGAAAAAAREEDEEGKQQRLGSGQPIIMATTGWRTLSALGLRLRPLQSDRRRDDCVHSTEALLCGGGGETEKVSQARRACLTRRGAWRGAC